MLIGPRTSFWFKNRAGAPPPRSQHGADGVGRDARRVPACRWQRHSVRGAAHSAHACPARGPSAADAGGTTRPAVPHCCPRARLLLRRQRACTAAACAAAMMCWLTAGLRACRSASAQGGMPRPAAEPCSCGAYAARRCRGQTERRRSCASRGAQKRAKFQTRTRCVHCCTCSVRPVVVRASLCAVSHNRWLVQLRRVEATDPASQGQGRGRARSGTRCCVPQAVHAVDDCGVAAAVLRRHRRSRLRSDH